MFASGGSVTVTGGSITQNTATTGYGYGGGIYANNNNTTTILLVDNVEISGNTATQGGGIYALSEAVVTLTNNTISGNDAAYGGGVRLGMGATCTMKSGTITGNSATTCGGGVYLYSGQTDSNGQAIDNGTAFTMTGGQICGNTAAKHSADVYSNTATITLSPITQTEGVEIGGKPITGWFWDGTPRWGESYTNRDKNVTGATGIQCLIAAHDEYFTVEYIVDEDSEQNQTYEVEKGTATPGFDGTPAREGCEFDGWSSEVAETVTGNVTYTAQWKGYVTVTYSDGVGGAAFESQVSTVLEGADTPAFEGTPTRNGYTFNGWSPEVADTVSESVTYTAQWTQNPSSGGSSGSGSSSTPSSPSTDSTEPSSPVEIDEPDVPLVELPEEADNPEIAEIGEPDVPLIELPEEADNAEIVDIGKIDVPLADVPETGDDSALWLILAGMAGAGLAWLILSKKRTETER